MAYEAARRRLRTLILDQGPAPASGASRWSLGGLTWLNLADARLLPLAWEGWERYQTLADELGVDTGFRPATLLALAQTRVALDRLARLVDSGRARGFQGHLVGPDGLAGLQPGLRADTLVGGAVCAQGHVDPPTLVGALLTAAKRLGAEVVNESPVHALTVRRGRCVGVETPEGSVAAGSVLLTAGAWTRSLLRSVGTTLPILHTHAEVLETPPQPVTLSCIVVGGGGERGDLERAMASRYPASEWRDAGDHDLVPPVLEFGAAQFPDGRIQIGQVSRAVPGLRAVPRPESEAAIRNLARTLLPGLADLPAALRTCPVSIALDRLPVAGLVPSVEGLYVMAGLPSPLIYLPALAPRMAALLAGETVPELEPFNPSRFAPAAPL